MSVSSRARGADRRQLIRITSLGHGSLGQMILTAHTVSCSDVGSVLQYPPSPSGVLVTPNPSFVVFSTVRRRWARASGHFEGNRLVRTGPSL
jgi:hypothetical protein